MRTRAAQAGVTLVELLVVVAIIGVMIAITLPAVQSSRESARHMQCASHLRQIGLAIHAHHDALGHIPSGGWGYTWVGVPGDGIGQRTGRRQPGGWIYNLLPYVEQQALYWQGDGSDDEVRREASAKRLATPISFFNCPSRRGGEAWPTTTDQPHLRNPHETKTVYFVARSDYAANGGHLYGSVVPGPNSLAEGDDPNYLWPNTDQLTGISFVRSEIRWSDVPDGTSNTYLVGEKYLSPDDYSSGEDVGDNESMYNGYCADVDRFGIYPPKPDEPGLRSPLDFGSAHRGGPNMLFCDGSVRTVAYEVELKVHQEQAHCRDGG